MAAIQKNILRTHISLMAQEQVQLEFREALMQDDNDDATTRLQLNPQVQQQLQMMTNQD